jgi:hypothetical protein
MRNKTKVIAIPMLFSGELVRAMITGEIYPSAAISQYETL